VIPQPPFPEACGLDRHAPEQLIYLHPGQMCFCLRPSRVETVLGSCVAVTMWNVRLEIGCICHAVLPLNESRTSEPLKYVDSSIHSMLQAMEKHASRRSDIEVKLFGGASMRQMAGGRRSVGSQNIEAALAVLRQEGLAPRSSDIGGIQGRKLRFYSATGEVFVKRIRMEADG
jgi:chemotaxis protein CheD